MPILEGLYGSLMKTASPIHAMLTMVGAWWYL